MYLICSTLCFSDRPLERALETIAELEFGGVEFGLLQRTSNHPTLGQALEDPDRIHAIFRSGPAVAVPAVYAEFPADGGHEAEERFGQLCRLAHSLKATVLTIPAAPRSVPLEAEIHRLSRFVRLATAEGLTLCIENQPGGHAETADGARALCEAVTMLGLTLDVAHYMSGPQRGEGFELVYPLVEHVQLRDAGTEPDQNQVPIGKGKIDYSRIVAYLAQRDYQRAISIEYVNEPPLPFDVVPEVRKLRLLLETLL